MADVSRSALAWAVAITAGWGIFVGYHIGDYKRSFLVAVVSGVIYSFIHPVIGKLAAVISEWLCDQIDRIYKIDSEGSWGDWSLSSRLLFASVWPIVMPCVVVVALIGIVYGLLFRSLFAR